jgi:hypothetical protein
MIITLAEFKSINYVVSAHNLLPEAESKYCEFGQASCGGFSAQVALYL